MNSISKELTEEKVGMVNFTKEQLQEADWKLEKW